MSPPSPSGGALAGLRVVEIASFISGPYCGQLLADLGADVIKIERPPCGDPFRAIGSADGYGFNFLAYNRNKRSALLDLRTSEDRDVVRGLLRTADVLIENHRPGVLARFGLDHRTIAASNPRLIYCSITGFGASGPYASRPAYDTVGQAVSGMLSVTLDPERPRITGPAFSDGITGLTAAYSILAALQARQRTGEGQLVEVPMLAATAAFLTDEATETMVSRTPSPYDRPSRSQAYAGRCADDRMLSVHLSSPQKFWESFASAIERPDLIDDSRFLTHSSRVANYDELITVVAVELRRRTRCEWLEIFAAHDVPAAPVYSMEEMLADDQSRHLGLRMTVRHPQHGDVPTVAPPARLSSTPCPELSAPPTLGEHTAQIRAEAISTEPANR